ncbi:hypothetical protein SY83_12640 [Paenibacillus swuensis]|uniref:Uncharacterized protein n=1 Tax=Paenibacillus swuensis TaxID=1178515 RepID=A0A172TIW3_9BACL|nr:hypothetical protein SY83_12640 [Paenibacillus swuensis]
MHFIFVFVNLFIVGFLLLSLFGVQTGKNGPFCRKRRRNQVLISLSQALVFSLAYNMFLYVH